MKFLVILVLCLASAFAVEQENELLNAFPESWYDAESATTDDDLLIPNFVNADDELAQDFGASRFDDNKNVLQVAQELGATKFVTAVRLLHLEDTFANTQGITVFVPSNRAFARLPKRVLFYLLRHPDRFAALLKYHAAEGVLRVKDLKEDATYHTLLGNLTLRYDSYTHRNSNYTTRVIQAAKISCREVDNVASNGIVHIIDEVVTKLPVFSAYDIISRSKYFSSLYNALIVAGMSDGLKGSGPLTLFAPTEKAIKRLPSGVWEALLKDVGRLTAVLDVHVVPKTTYARGLADQDVLSTLNKSNSLTVHVRNAAEVFVNDAKIIYFDGAVTNGVIHAIDEVIIPPQIMEALIQ